MPKLVDHEERRAAIAAAAFRVIARDGLAATSVRAVVAESGFSSGALRHYFATHDELVHSVGDLLVDRSENRRRRLLRDESTGVDGAFRLCAAVLPIDPERAEELTVFASLADLTRTDPGHDDYRKRAWLGTRDTARAAVDLVAADPASDERRRAASDRLHWILDGLAAQHVLYPGAVPPSMLADQLRRTLVDLATDLGR